MSDLLDEYEAKTGHFVPIHGKFFLFLKIPLINFEHTVDAASGGFVAPFATVS
jgi:glutamate decarboxylase